MYANQQHIHAAFEERYAGRSMVRLIDVIRDNFEAGRAVVRVTDGKLYRNVAQAAKAHGAYPTGVFHAIHQGHRCRGHHWRFATEEDIRQASAAQLVLAA